MDEPAHLFLDTHVLLHYTFFTDIDWTSIARTSVVELIIPYTVISELDDQKFNSSDPAVKSRARSVTRAFKKIAQAGSQVKSNVALRLLSQEPSMEFENFGLNRFSEDDRIIAEILSFREKKPSSDLALVTADLGLTLKAKSHQIVPIEPPESLLVPDRPTPDARLIKELEAELAEIKNMRPQLQVRFGSGLNRLHPKLSSPKTFSEEQIGTLVQQKRAGLMNAYALDIIESAAVEVQLDEYRSYLDSMNKYALRRSNKVELKFFLFNDGSGPAEDTDIDINVGEILILNRHYIGEPPKESQPPPKPRAESIRQRIFQNALSPVAVAATHFEKPNVSGPTITPKRVDSGTDYCVHFHVERIKQKTEVELDVVYAAFSSISEAKSFTLTYTLNSRSLPDKITDQLHVIIERP
jgi:hypothetical protein